MYSSLKVFFFSMLSLVFLIFTTCFFSGCTVGPDYNCPELAVSGKWHTQMEKGISAEEMNQQLLSSWWTAFNDDLLTSLIDRAVAGNLDIKNAQSRIRQARASRRRTAAGLIPNMNVSGSDTWTQSSSETGDGLTSQRLSTSFDSAWELDIFGGTRRAIQAADADLQSSRENLRDVLVSLQAEVAINYIEVRTYQARLAAVNENLQAQSETYQLTVWRNEAGLSDELSVQQARYNLESTRAEIPSIRTSLEESLNRIAVLLGEQPGEVHNELENSGPIPAPPSQVAVGVPAEMLRRRPDIRKAERDLAAQTAQIGVATAELYPSFSLSGSISVDGTSFNRFTSNLSTTDNWVLSGGPRLSWAIFDAGSIRQNIIVQTELQQQALIQYESAVISAIEEVENNIMAYMSEQDRNDNLKEAVDAAQRAAALSQQEYQAGLTDFSNVLDAQRSLLSFQNQLAQSNGTVISNLIRLYKSLGGGWLSLASEENNEMFTGEKNEK